MTTSELNIMEAAFSGCYITTSEPSSVVVAVCGCFMTTFEPNIVVVAVCGCYMTSLKGISSNTSDEVTPVLRHPSVKR